MVIKCTVTPKKYRFVPNILPDHKRIEEQMTLELNKAEVRKCMNEGCLVAILKDGKEVPLDEKNWYVEFNKVEEEEPPKPPEEIGYAFMGKAMIGYAKIM